MQFPDYRNRQQGQADIHESIPAYPVISMVFIYLRPKKLRCSLAEKIAKLTCTLGSQHLPPGTYVHSALGGLHCTYVNMAPEVLKAKVETMQKYRKRRHQTSVELIILNITHATEILAAARDIMPNVWVIQFSFRTVEISVMWR